MTLRLRLGGQDWFLALEPGPRYTSLHLVDETATLSGPSSFAPRRPGTLTGSMDIWGRGPVVED